MDARTLRFRRQYILAPMPVFSEDRWPAHEIAPGAVLSVHPDLECHVRREFGSRTVALLGFWVDPERPERGSGDILDALLVTHDTYEGVREATHGLSGRWALVYRDASTFRVFHDPCGLRQVFYQRTDEGVQFAAQPELFRAVFGLDRHPDEELHTFMQSEPFIRQQHAMVGTATPYAGVFHLLPNHDLDLHSGVARRYFPTVELETRTVGEVADEAAAILRGTLQAYAERAPLRLGVTAGWDSRVLLSASRTVRDRTDYYVVPPAGPDGGPNERHPDVVIPRRLTKRLDLPFRVEWPTRAALPEFVEAMREGLTYVRTNPRKLAALTARGGVGGTIGINGNVSEIARRFYPRPPNGTPPNLPAVMGYRGEPYAERVLSEWTTEVEGLGLQTWDVLDLLYWEQRMGNWGSQTPAEVDFVGVSASPFNCRRLLFTLLSAPPESRCDPDYPLYGAIIERLWPEVASEPVNVVKPSGLQALRAGAVALVPERAKAMLRRALRATQ